MGLPGLVVEDDFSGPHPLTLFQNWAAFAAEVAQERLSTITSEFADAQKL